MPAGPRGDAIVDAVGGLAGRLRIGAWNDVPEPFMGPLVSANAAARALDQVHALERLGARPIIPFRRINDRAQAFVSIGMLDVTGLDVPDEEIFAPLLQIHRVADFDTAIKIANSTSFGLAGGLISNDDNLWARYLRRGKAGVLNRNRPTTGAAATMPFGGVGRSGNHRPSAYYAADYCAYPVASFEAALVLDQAADLRGLV